MKFKEILVTSYLFNTAWKYSDSYEDITKINLNLSKKQDVLKLISFLRKWGCRQLAEKYTNTASAEISKWYSMYNKHLPSLNDELHQLSEKKILTYDTLFSDLTNKIVSTKKTESKSFDVHLGPVGASKALFAIRPKLFAPWDNAIIETLKLSPDGSGYCEYLKIIRNHLLELKAELTKNRITNSKFKSLIGRDHFTMVKLADEWMWINYTKNCKSAEIIKLCK